MRPKFDVESTKTVGRGVVQLEMGYLYTYKDKDAEVEHAHASPETLLRRLHLDLIGLPPSPAELAVYLADPPEQRYERAVERLLSSPHYGERWARHWLDVARFGESHGYEADNERHTAWTFRDAVIYGLVRPDIAAD